MTVIVLLFTIIYIKITSLIDFEYNGSILVTSNENNTTIYSGKIKGKKLNSQYMKIKTLNLNMEIKFIIHI